MHVCIVNVYVYVSACVCVCVCVKYTTSCIQKDMVSVAVEIVVKKKLVC